MEQHDKGKDKTTLDESQTEYGLTAAWDYLKAFLRDVLDLEKGVNKRNTINEIRDKKSMAGANAWMLMCSIVIACIGLSQNSQAVIIGAMLISPLMSPILGVGLSVGINDMDTLRTSLIHFGAAIVIALLTSTIYFVVFDFPEITSEISSRTKPTFLDIFVAIFGGIAGIISIARKDISTTLPGVAIATALMPPLCVTGYGIANLDHDIALKSFYLFFLNTFFVSLATYLIVRFLRFPFKDYVKQTQRRKNTTYIVMFSLLLIVPSVYLFKGVIDDAYDQAAVNNFYRYCLGDKQKYLDSYRLERTDDEHHILYLKCYGDSINKDDTEAYEECLKTYGMDDVAIEIIPSSEVNLDHFSGLEKDLQDLDDQLKAVKAIKQEQAAYIQNSQSSKVDSITLKALDKELKILYPELVEVQIGSAASIGIDGYQSAEPIILPRWKNTNAKRQNEKELIAFIKARLSLDSEKNSE